MHSAHTGQSFDSHETRVEEILSKDQRANLEFLIKKSCIKLYRVEKNGLQT